MKTFYIVVGCLVFVIAVILLLRVLRSKQYVISDGAKLAYINGLPVLPRDQRNLNVKNHTPALDQEIIKESETEMHSHQNGGSQAVPYEPDELVERPQTMQQRGSKGGLNNVIDIFLNEAKAFDCNNSPLLNAEEVVTMVVIPRNNIGVTGKEVLNIARQYGLKYGVKNMCHRYENSNGSGDLWFSMMGRAYDGTEQSFDLNTLYESHWLGLTFFLALPNPNAARGYSSMTTTISVIAKDLNADIFDDEGHILNDEDFKRIRLQIANYQN